MNRPQRTRNPGNLRFAGQREAIGKDLDGFAIFPDDAAGWRALVAQIKLDQSRGLTFEQFIHKYAPPSENDSDAYLKAICQGIITRPDQPIDSFSPYALCGLMARQEGYFNKDEVT